MKLQFDVFGKLSIRLVKRPTGWLVSQVCEGTLRPLNIPIPSGATPEEIAVILDDHFHELAGPGDVVTRVQ